MGRRTGVISGLLGVGLLAGCGGKYIAPIAPPPHREAIPAGYDLTWRALIQALAKENVPLRAVARDSGVIASDHFVTPIGVYADCGRLGDALLEGEAVVTFTLFVQPNHAGGTELQINPKMQTRAYRKGSSGSLKRQPVFQCASTGRWEANLLDSVRRSVGK
ncbi:MAG: hypothetical protein AAB285_08825 [candidate division NC10 bacterium]